MCRWVCVYIWMYGYIGCMGILDVCVYWMYVYIWMYGYIGCMCIQDVCVFGCMGIQVNEREREIRASLCKSVRRQLVHVRGDEFVTGNELIPKTYSNFEDS